MNKRLLIKYVYAIVVPLFFNPATAAVGLFMPPTSLHAILTTTVLFITYSGVVVLLVSYLFRDVAGNFRDSLAYTAPVFLVMLFGATFQGTVLGLTAAYTDVNLFMKGMINSLGTVTENLRLAIASLYAMPISVALWLLMAYVTNAWAKRYLSGHVKPQLASP